MSASAASSRSPHQKRSTMSATAKLTVPRLLKMSQNELDDLYTNSPSGDIPDGDCEGTIIVAPRTVITPIKAKLMHLFGWQGKVFDKKKEIGRASCREGGEIRG